MNTLGDITCIGADANFDSEHGIPPLLARIPDAPRSLWCIGNLPLLYSTGCVAVIGTRQPTEAGAAMAHRIAMQLASIGHVIVSGLANGIDTMAHQGALAVGGLTIAVLASIDEIYPRNNVQLARQIVASGGLLVAEHPPGYSWSGRDLFQRDRIQSGLSIATIPVQTAHWKDDEGKQVCGTIHTCEYAYQQGRQLFVPQLHSVAEDYSANPLAYEGLIFCAQSLGAKGFDPTQVEASLGPRLDALQHALHPQAVATPSMGSLNDPAVAPSSLPVYQGQRKVENFAAFAKQWFEPQSQQVQPRRYASQKQPRPEGFDTFYYHQG